MDCNSFRNSTLILRSLLPPFAFFWDGGDNAWSALPRSNRLLGGEEGLVITFLDDDNAMTAGTAAAAAAAADGEDEFDIDASEQLVPLLLLDKCDEGEEGT